jgi:hypothetical protein
LQGVISKKIITGDKAKLAYLGDKDLLTQENQLFHESWI